MKKIESVADYVKNGIESGTMKVAIAIKGIPVTAVQVCVGRSNCRSFCKNDQANNNKPHRSNHDFVV